MWCQVIIADISENIQAPWDNFCQGTLPKWSSMQQLFFMSALAWQDNFQKFGDIMLEELGLLFNELCTSFIIVGDQVVMSIFLPDEDPDRLWGSPGAESRTGCGNKMVLSCINCTGKHNRFNIKILWDCLFLAHVESLISTISTVSTLDLASLIIL